MNRDYKQIKKRKHVRGGVVGWRKRLFPAFVIAVFLALACTGCGGSGRQNAGQGAGDGQAADMGQQTADIGQQKAEAGQQGAVQDADAVAQSAGQSGEIGQQAAAASLQEAAGGAVYDVLEVHFIDVGQGDATLLKCGDSAMLIDAGESDQGTAIQNYLQKQGVEKLDCLVLTHPDADHIGGAPVIITKFDPDRVLVSNFQKDNATYRKLIQALDDKRLKAQTASPGSSFALGTAVCTVLAPNGEYDNPNDASVALLVENGQTSFLFTGDAGEDVEKDILAAFPEIRADVYKAGHHGSNTSSGEAFLDAVCPSWAVVSCAEGNSYGHPHARTLNNLRSRGIQVYRTDEQGSLTAVSDGSGITWNAAPSDTWKAGEPTGAGTAQPGGGTGQSAGAPQVNGNVQQPDGSEGQPAGAPQVNGNVQQPGGSAGQSAGAPQVNGNVQQPDGSEGQMAAPPQPEDSAGAEPADSAPVDGGDHNEISYVLNTKTMKFHIPTCSYLPTANRADTAMSREDILAEGYEPCKKCNP